MVNGTDQITFGAFFELRLAIQSSLEALPADLKKQIAEMCTLLSECCVQQELLLQIIRKKLLLCLEEKAITKEKTLANQAKKQVLEELLELLDHPATQAVSALESAVGVLQKESSPSNGYGLMMADIAPKPLASRSV